MLVDYRKVSRVSLERKWLTDFAVASLWLGRRTWEGANLSVPAADNKRDSPRAFLGFHTLSATRKSHPSPTHVKMVKKRASKYESPRHGYSLDVALTLLLQRSQQEGSWPRQARPLLQLLAMRS